MLAIYNHSIIGIFITCFFLVVIATIQNESHAFSKLPAPRRIHLSQFPELLARSFLQRNLRLSDLYDHQRKAVKKGLFLGKNLVVRTDTDTGKTDIAFIYEFRSLLRGLVGVYLVPHKRLLVDKRWQLENFFTASSGSAPPQELAHVITISGESKPSEKELQKHSKRLIIVATYEAFRAFYFEAQSRKYFHKRRWVGTVVIDESHMVFNKERGLRLETLIYKLKKEQDPQFCLLSATMTERQARWWSRHLGAQLIYEPPRRVFNYEELSIHLPKKAEGISRGVDVQAVRSRGKYTRLERKKINKVCERIKERLSKYKGKSQRILVFCYARWLAREMAQAIRGQVNDEDAGIWCWCEMIHAGLTLEDQDHIFQQFLTRPSRNKILVSSPLLETGINVPAIDLIIVVDPELYSVTSLEQMCGRLRKKKSTDKAHELELNKDRKIIFVITEEFRQQIEQKFELNETHTQILRFNLELDLWVYPNMEYTRLSLELLFRRVMTKKQVLQGLRELSYHPKYQERVWWSELIPLLFSLSKLFLQLSGNSSARNAPAGISQKDLFKLLQTLTKWFDWLSGRSIDAIFKDIYLTRLLKELENHELIRKSGNRGGKYALTLVGDAVVETGVDFSAALDILGYVREHTSWSKRFIAKLVAERTATGYSSRPELLAKRRAAIGKFLVDYNNKNPVKNFDSRRKHKIDSGDERKLRQTALWYSISLSVIYSAFRLQQAPLKPGSRSYYDREPPHLPDSQVFYRKANCFQIPGEVAYREKPPPYPRKGHPAPIDVSKRVEGVLKRWGKNGATIREIQLEEPNLSHAIISTALNGPLASKVFKELERLGLPHRPSYRFWLRKYKRTRSRKYSCSACAHFQAKKGRFGDPPKATHCKQGNPCESRWHDTCEQFGIPKKGNFYIYYRQHFKIAEGGLVRCPHCRHYGTMQIPTFEVAYICRNCKIILKQVRRGVFHGRVVPRIFELLEGRIADLSTTPWVKIDKYNRKIYLKARETLHVEDPLKTKVAVLQVNGRKESGLFRRRSNKYFFDEVKVVYLGDKTARITPPNGRQILEANGIHVERIKQPPSKKRRVLLQDLLREILLTLQGNSALKIAAEATSAKILTSLHYSLCLRRLLPDKKQSVWQESLYKQLDQLIQVRFLLEGQEKKAFKAVDPWIYIDMLRSREGIAEKAAWILIKAALPTRFQFLSRKVQRAVRSDLHSGSKARDPYNAALNSLFWKLQGEAMKALEVGGFNRYYPGVGFLHRRHRKPPVIEHEKNRALIFDFIDPYRPLFRYYLLWAFQTRNASPEVEDSLEAWCLEHRFSETKDFEDSEDMWGEPVYTLTKSGEAKVEALFWRVCTRTFEYQGELLPLWEIMRREAKSLAADLLSFFLSHRAYSTFTVLEKGEITEYCNNLTHLLNESEDLAHVKSAEEKIIEEPTISIPERQQEQQLHLSPPKLLFTNRYKNVIIVTHVDKDGFQSALLQIIKYYYWNHPKRGKVRILTATPTSLKFVLEHEVTPLLWTTRDAHNTLIVTDFDVDIFLKDKTFFQNLRHDYLQEVSNDASRLDFHWYDHHILKDIKSTDLHQFHKPFGVQFHHDTSLDTYQIIVREMDAEQRFYDCMLKSQVLIGGLGLFSLFLRLIQIAQHQKKSYIQKKLAEIHLLTPKEEFDTQNLCEYFRVFRRLLLSQFKAKDNLQDYNSSINNSVIIDQVRKFQDALDFNEQLGKPPRSRRPRDPAMDRKRCDPWIFYKRLQLGENIEYLRKWGDWFVEYTSGMQARPQRSWFNFFKTILSEITPPTLETKPPEDPKDILHYSKIFATKNAIPIGVHVFSHRYSVKRAYELLKLIYGFIPPINYFYWSDLTVSLWASGGLDLSGYLAYFDAYMHPGAGRIRNLEEKLFQVGKKQILSYLYSLRTLKECVAWNCQLDVTDKPADFSLGDIPIIPEDTRPLYEIFGEFIKPQNIDSHLFTLLLPERDPFMFYPGDVTLLYSRIQKEGGNVASKFLHHLLCVYLEQCANEGSSERQYEVLFIKSNVGGQQLQDERLLHQGMSQNQLRKVLKTAPLDWPTLKVLIDRCLHQIIMNTKVNLIVLWRPFALIWKHLKTLDKHTQWKRYSRASAELVGSLRAIAAQTGTHIILTLNYVYSDTQNPYLPWETRNRLRQRIYVKWAGRGFESLVQERQYGATWEDSDEFTLPPLPWTDRSRVLATACGFPRGIDPVIPPDLIRQIPELHDKFMRTVGPSSETAIEEWEEAWSEEKVEPELEVEVKEDLGRLYPEDEEKLKEPPTLRSTAHGLKFLVWRFRADKSEIKNLLALLHDHPQEREFDLVYWANQDYHIYNSVYLLDLFETHFGAAPCQGGTQTGQAVCFTHEFPGVHPFEKFLQGLELLFIDFRQLSAFLKQIRDELMANELATKNTDAPAQVIAKRVELFFLQLLPIFGFFPPYPPWDIPKQWELFLRELRRFFPWDQVRGITEILLEKLQGYHVKQRRVGKLDTDKLRDSLRKALQAPWKDEKPKMLPGATFTPLPNQEDYRQECLGLSSVESIPAPMIPMFPILRFVFNAYRSPQEVAAFRASLPITRIFDICLYAEDWQKKRKYHVFSTVVDLSCLEVLGGVGSETNIYFRYGQDPRVSRFDEFFEQFSTLDPTEFPFLGWKPFRNFLSFARDERKELESREGLSGPPSNPPPYTNVVVNQFKERILPILIHPQPTLTELTLWSEIIQELRTYFDWRKIKDITEVILSEIDYSTRDSRDMNEVIEAAIAAGLKRGLPPENR